MLTFLKNQHGVYSLTGCVIAYYMNFVALSLFLSLLQYTRTVCLTADGEAAAQKARQTEPIFIQSKLHR